MSLCHLFTFYLSEKEVWEPCGVTWHFVIRLIVFPAGWSPSNLPHTQHFTAAPRPFAIFWIYGSVRTGLQRWKRMPLQDNGKKKQKHTKSHGVTAEQQQFQCAVYSAGWLPVGLMQCFSPWNVSEQSWSQSPKLSETFVFCLRAVTRSGPSDASNREKPFWSNKFCPSPLSLQEFQNLDVIWSDGGRRYATVWQRFQKNVLWFWQWWAGALGKGCLLFPPWLLHR